MAKTDLPIGLRDLVRARAQNCCEYCLTAEMLSGARGEIDHVTPRARQGQSRAENLALACPACNGHKHACTHAVDSASGKRVPLFNPRQQKWSDHFAWNLDRTEIIGLTAIGRATVAALQMNDPLIVTARALWASIHAHPPRDL